MLARLQRIITLTLLALAAVWATVFLRADRPLWALAGALLILTGHSLVLAIEFAMLGHVGRHDPAPRPTPLQWLRAWWGEVVSATLVFGWQQPFRANAEPDFVPVGLQVPAHGRGVVLVHGYVCNRGIWNPWMRRLRAARVPFVAVNLEPLFGSVDAYAPLIERAVAQLEAATGLPPVVVAHSMGGLATRAWLQAYAADARVHRVITIGTPHRGTWLARFGRSINGLQMRLDGDWQKQLAAREPAWRFERFTCFYSHCDNIVFPASTATLPGASNRHVTAAAHVHMVFRPEVYDEAMRWLRPAPE